jgi:hypothetical protein
MKIVSSIKDLPNQLIYELAQGLISNEYDKLLAMPPEVLNQINKRLRTVPVSFWPDEIQQFGDLCALSLLEETIKKFRKCLKEFSNDSAVSSTDTVGFTPITLPESESDTAPSATQ